MDDDVHTDHTIRIILVGDSSTGKTSLLLRYIDTKFSVKSVATVGNRIDFRTKIMTFGSTVVKVQIFDTAGQERFHTITQAYYRNAAGALIVFDITNQATFRSIQSHSLHYPKDSVTWLTDMDAQAAQAVKVIVGNKCDLEESRSVPRNQAQKLAEDIGCRYLEASAMTGQNVEEAFISTIQAILVKKGILPNTAPSSLTEPALPNGAFHLRSSVEMGKTEEENSSCC